MNVSPGDAQGAEAIAGKPFRAVGCSSGSRVPRTELYEARIASSKPSLGFFILLISSAVIATLGLISYSTAVVIGAMIVAH